MKQKFMSVLLALLLVLLPTVGVLPVTAQETYELYVGGVAVTETNAADVLGDGTVSYDAEAKVLTLNNASIDEYHTFTAFSEKSYAGIYSEIDGLRINLVGKNKIVTVIEEEGHDDTAAAIHSSESIEVSGSGELSIRCWAGITCLQDVLIKDCSLSFSAMGISSMSGDVTVDGASLEGQHGLIMGPSSDIVLRNATVDHSTASVGDAMGMMLYTDTGSVTVTDSEISSTSAIPFVLGEGGGTVTVKDTKLELDAMQFGFMAPSSKGVFEGVTGTIDVRGETAYGMYFGNGVTLTGCDLRIVCRATEDAACPIFSMRDITVTDSRLELELSAPKEVAVGLGNIEAATTDVTATGSTLTIRASGGIAAGIYAANVKLTDCETTIEATASAGGGGFGAGITADGGRTVIRGGRLDVTVTGPEEGEEPTYGILMTSELLVPEFIDADVLIRGNRVMNGYPDLTEFGREYGVFASTDVRGEEVADFTEETLESLRYLHVYPLYTVEIDGNGGEGEMFEPEKLYGEYTLPENGFTAPEGMQFKGWSLSKDGEVLTGESITLRADTVLYAVWEKIPSEESTGDPEGSDTLPSPEDPDHTHAFADVWTQTDTEHYKACACGAKQYAGAHVDSNENGACDVCGFEAETDGLPVIAIVGIAVGAVLLIGVGGFAVVWFAVKKKTLADLSGEKKGK